MSINIADEITAIERLRANIARYQRHIDEHEEVEARVLSTVPLATHEANIIRFSLHVKVMDLKRSIEDHQRQIAFVQLRIDAASALTILTGLAGGGQLRGEEVEGIANTILALAKGCQIGEIE